MVLRSPLEEAPFGAQGQSPAPTLLDKSIKTARSYDSNREKRARRCFQRAISGIQVGGPIRMLTLTSAPYAEELSGRDIQKAFRALVMRLRRRGYLSDYFKVREYTKKGRPHLHVLFRGRYLPKNLVRRFWMDLYASSIVDVRIMKGKEMASYVSKYMSKDERARYSWSWDWVWKGFSADWKKVKEKFNWDMPKAIRHWSGVLREWGGYRGLEPVSG